MDTTWKGSAAGAPVREINIAPDVCPVCDAVTVRWHSIKGYPICECIGCHHRFVPGAQGARHVQETFDNAYFSDGGAGYPGYLNEARSFASAVAAMLASSPVIFPREGCWTWAARRDSSSAGSLIAAGRGGVGAERGDGRVRTTEWVRA